MRIKVKSEIAQKKIRVKPSLANDPIKAQYQRASMDGVGERLGPFEIFDPDRGKWPLSPQQRRIMQEVIAYDEEWIHDILVPLVSNTSDNRTEPSLRVLDWFVTNYAKSRGVSINNQQVHVNYIDVRRVYQCRNFDPFRRNLKITVYDRQGDKHYTTVAQVNFLLWAHTSGVLEYVRQHRQSVEDDMAQVCKFIRDHRQKCKKEGKPCKRQSLSAERKPSCVVFKRQATINYSGRVIRV